MYQLTLTHRERSTIDFIGGRYTNGHDLFKLLWVESAVTPKDQDWDSDYDITFNVPEWVAWQIQENAGGEDGFWPYFGETLAAKMQQFCDNIV